MDLRYAYVQNSIQDNDCYPALLTAVGWRVGGIVRCMTGRLLVTGATGHLGRRVHERAAAAGWTVVGTYHAAPAATASEQLDIRDRAAVLEVLRRVRPDLVIHTAKGRDQNDWRATADGAAHGAAKAAAETSVRAIVPDAAVVRTSIILGDGRGAQELLTHDLASGRRSGALFTDEIRMPVHVDDLADALLELAVHGHRGVLNVAGPEAMSRYDLGLLVAARDGLDPASIPAARSADLPEARPLDVRLVTDRAQSILHTRLRGATEFMAAAAGADA
jgi:dTDP-4-dehydrorhamnose reductase